MSEPPKPGDSGYEEAMQVGVTAPEFPPGSVDQILKKTGPQLQSIQEIHTMLEEVGHALSCETGSLLFTDAANLCERLAILLRVGAAAVESGDKPTDPRWDDETEASQGQEAT